MVAKAQSGLGLRLLSGWELGPVLNQWVVNLPLAGVEAEKVELELNLLEGGLVVTSKYSNLSLLGSFLLLLLKTKSVSVSSLGGRVLQDRGLVVFVVETTDQENLTVLLEGLLNDASLLDEKFRGILDGVESANLGAV
jgi:hypothetical protein